MKSNKTAPVSTTDEVLEEAFKNPALKKAIQKELRRLQSVRGAKGGKETLKRRGVGHYSTISNKRWGTKAKKKKAKK